MPSIPPGRDLAAWRREQVTVPAKYGIGPDQQRDPGGQEGPVAGTERGPGAAQLPLQDRDLVAQCQDLDLLVPVVHSERAQ
jgi:hypothetical protein